MIHHPALRTHDYGATVDLYPRVAAEWSAHLRGDTLSLFDSHRLLCRWTPWHAAAHDPACPPLLREAIATTTRAADLAMERGFPRYAR
jgi:hypothetical protein